MPRMDPERRRQAIVEATLAVARTKGLGGTTVRDVATEMGSSSGLIHHYFETMDDVLAAAFDQAARADLQSARDAVEAHEAPTRRLRALIDSFRPTRPDPTMQLWLDAWAEAARRPALQETSRELNLQWHELLMDLLRSGVDEGWFVCSDPAVSAWRLLSLLDGLALQAVAHPTILDRTDVVRWALEGAERELDIEPGTLSSEPGNLPTRISKRSSGNP